MQHRPHLSRDGGKGGYLNCESIFVFSDTASYSPVINNVPGEFQGFVATSVAIDLGLNGANGQPLVLRDGVGEWSDDVGRQRGFIPSTTGEQVFNLNMQGYGYRIATWPSSSLIPWNQSHALLYIPIIYDDGNTTGVPPVFTNLGITLAAVSIPTEAGPRADRLSPMLFYPGEVEWGGLGGVRSYGAEGPGGNDGKIYVYGGGRQGLLLGRVDANEILDREAYEYWNEGGTWSSGAQSPTSAAVFLGGNYSSVDIFYSPRHLTYILVYLPNYADNAFYYRYLLADHAIIPSYAGGTDDDIAENLVRYSWSNETLLYQAEPGLSGAFISSGGIHQGYFGDDDITNGGTSLLLQWSVPTGLDPAGPTGEYQLITARVEWG
ncbi:hypothetical protein K402DRAFT_423353 [Aulographum hederae CBS 113979]|uniref:DUF4185 domain-containing protein n=1 Tax=Aulographum hederae CBS 113979 TaxID=1176131 RepID=A0A6G1GSM7_9PEZI|nr:hypothetical protein K402DRAFT_423353 [Aulographum hederae CBS 113979]